MKRYRVFLFPILIFCLPALMAAGYMLRFGYSWDESWTATKGWGKTGTRYGQGYDESAFARLQPGMTGKQVYAQLGQPMEGHVVNGKPGDLWRYSLVKAGKQAFHERAVVFLIEEGKPPVVESLIRRYHHLENPD